MEKIMLTVIKGMKALLWYLYALSRPDSYKANTAAIAFYQATRYVTVHIHNVAPGCLIDSGHSFVEDHTSPGYIAETSDEASDDSWEDEDVDEADYIIMSRKIG
jgi:hypothetical protein